MRYFAYFIAALFVFIGCRSTEYKDTETKNLLKYANPMIGTGGHGHTYPGAVVPFGMVQLSPDNGTEGWDWCSGYNYADSTIAGFSHLHLSGTGVGDLYDILYMPVVGKMDFPETYQRTSELQYFPDSRKSEPMPYWSAFSHADEEAHPGYYRVLLKDYGIEAELTATRRAGLQRYTFPESPKAAVVLDLGHSLNWDYPGTTHVQVVDSQTVAGYRESSGWAEKQKVWFFSRFSKPFANAEMVEQGRRLEQQEYTGKKLKAVFRFRTDEQEQILLKTAVSHTCAENAKANLEQELPGWDFEKVREQAENAWNKQLGKIAITASEEQKQKFYSALYHTMLAPNVFSDVNGQYRGMDRQIHKAEGYEQYTIFSLWDTFRASHPLFSLMHPNRVDDFIRSLLARYEETGTLPKWPLVANQTHGMIGYHAVSVIAEAWLKGYRDYDGQKAFEAMKATAMRDTFGRKIYREKDYIPADAVNYSVSRTLEYAYNDWCIARMAETLDKPEEAAYFDKRAASWKNVYDTTTHFMRGRNQDGTWVTPFNPLHSNHFSHPYIEGNAWQYNWFVPHHTSEFIKMAGGKKRFIQKLDSLFALAEQVEGEQQSVDISGMIGQYAHGNEPGHHIAYLYTYAGAPWKTQQKADTIMKTMYGQGPEGLCGNEDCGQMSAWYVLSALGFYPVNPVSGVYVFGSPQVQSARLSLPGSKTLTITTKKQGPKNKYIHRIERNGKPYRKAWITHKNLVKGGSITFYMGSKSAKETWSKTPLPPDTLVY